MKSLFKTKILALLLSFCFIVGIAPAMTVQATSATASPAPTEAPELERKTYNITCWPYLDAKRRTGYHYYFEADYYSFVKTHVLTYNITGSDTSVVYVYLNLYSMSPITNGMRQVYYPLTGVYEEPSEFKGYDFRETVVDGLTIYDCFIEFVDGFEISPDSLRGYPNADYYYYDVYSKASAQSQASKMRSSLLSDDYQKLLFLYSGLTDWDDIYPPSGSGSDTPSHGGGGSGHGGNSDGYVDDAFNDDGTDYGILDPIVKWFKAIVSTLVSIPTKIITAFSESDFGQKILEYLSYVTSIPSNIWNSFTETEVGKKYLEFTDKMVSFYDWYFDKFSESPFGKYIIGIYDYVTNLHTNLDEAFNEGSFFQTVKAIPTAITDAMKDAFPFLSDIEDRFKQTPLGGYIYGMWSAVGNIYDYMTEAFEDGTFVDGVKSIPGKIIGLPGEIVEALRDAFPIFSEIEDKFKSSPLGRLLYSYYDFYSGIFDYLSDGLEDGSFWDAVKGIPDKIIGLPSAIGEILEDILPEYLGTWDGMFEFFDEHVFVSFDDIRSHYDDLMSVPFLASIRSTIDIIGSHMDSWGKKAPVITIPLSSSYLSNYGVQDMVIDFSWFDKYRSTVLTVESAFLIVVFAFRSYFDVKNLLNGAGGAVSSIHSIID